MALTANRDVDHYVDQELRSFHMAVGQHVYRGALVGLLPSGHVRPLRAGDPFIGIAYEEMDNSKGVDRACLARVHTLGDFGMELPGATLADIGRSVFASSDDNLTLLNRNVVANNTYVGYIQGIVQDGEIILRLATLAKAP